jgi:V-type H+-transporting ATPase subunit H
MILDLIENVSHDKGLMAYILPTLEAIISESPLQFKQFMRATTKAEIVLFHEPCVYEAAAKFITMIIAG